MAQLTLKQQQAIAIAKAQAEAQTQSDQNAQLEAEINARGPKNTSGSPDDRQVANDQAAQENYDNNYQSGIANIPHNTILEAQGLAKGAANAVTGTIQTANAVGHSIGAGLGRAYDAVAPSIGLSPRDPASVKAASEQADREQAALQGTQFKETTGPDKFFMPAGQIGANIALAGGVGGAVKSGVTKALGEGAVAKAGGYAAGGLAGGAAAASSFPNQEGLVVRSNGLAGFDVKPDDDAATTQTKKFINQSLDNAALGAAGDALYRAGGKGLEVVRNLYNDLTRAHSLPKLKQDQMESLMTIFGGYGEHPTAEQAQEAMNRAIKAIDEKGSQAIDFGKAGEKTVKKDTIQSLIDSLDPNNPMDRSISNKLESLRASAKRGVAPRTTDQIMEPQRVLNQGIEESRNVRGGDEAIQQTTKNLQDRAQSEAIAHDVPVEMAKDDIAKRSADYTDVLEKDPTFGPVIANAKQEGTTLDINKMQRDIKGNIVTKSNAAHDADRAIRNAAYDKVSETGVPYGPKLWNDAVKKADEYIPNNIKTIIDNSDGTYGYLNNEVRPRLSEAISAARKGGDYTTASALQELRDNITEKQIDYIKKKAGGSATARLADEATQANKDYSAKWNDTIGKELRSNKDNNRFSPGTMQEHGRDIVDSAVSNPNRLESVENLKNILGPNDEGLVSDLAISKATQDIAAGKEPDIEKVISSLQKTANSFGPKQKERLESFFTDLRTKKMSIEDLKKQLPALEDAADAEKENIFGERFPGLFRKATNGKQIPKGNGYDVFDKAMANAQPDEITALVNEAKKNPGDLEGIQSAWLKSADKRINSPKSIGKLDENFIENGKKIFGDDSEEIKAITTLRDMSAKIEESANKPGNDALSATEHSQRFNTALSSIRTWVFGVLNPKAAKIRTVMNRMSEAYNPTETSHQAIDELLADNQEAKQVLQQLIVKYKNQLSPATWKTLWEAGAKMGLYKARQATGSDYQLNTQTDKALSK